MATKMTREEALNKVRQMSLPKETMEILEALAPELAESKDERIRRKMLEHFRSKTKETWCNIPVKDIIAYLEKQKECVSNNFDDVWAEEDCEEIIAEGQKLTPRFKELLKEVCHAWYDRGAKLEKQKSGLSFVGDFQAKTLQGPIELAEWKEAAKIREWILAKMQELAATGVPCSDEIKMADKAIDYLIKQKEYIEEPKIAFRDWGDKEKKEAIITCLKYMRFIKKITNQEYDDLIKWLANNTISNVSEKEECLREVKQKEQKPAEWSEEDEKKIIFLERLIEFNVPDGQYGWVDGMKGGFVTKSEAISMLKSLRPQYHGDVTMTEAYKMGLEAGKASSWKPSEEDLMMLEHIIGQYEIGNKNSKVMGYLPRIEELDFLKKVLAKWKN